MNKENILVCAECGSQDVQTQAWIKPNANDLCDGYLGIDDSDNNWCCECEEFVELITLEEYEKRNNLKNNDMKKY